MKTNQPLWRALGALVLMIAGATTLVVDGSAAAEPPATRTLDAINIEGAVDVPQVLFITSRDNARFDDGLAELFLAAAEAACADEKRPPLLRPYPFPKDVSAADLSVTANPAPPEAKE